MTSNSIIIDQLSIPDKEIEEIFQLHSSLSIKEQLNLFNIIINKISNWLESVHVSVFTLEKNVKNQYSNSNDTDYSTQHLESAMQLMDPIIQLLPELCELIEHKCNLNNEQLQLEYIKKITKLQSEWSSLQHFTSSVKKLLLSQRESKKLLNIIEQLIFQIDDISVLIFDFQEKKYHAFALPTSSSLSESSSITTTDNTTIISNTTEEFNKEDLMINEIDYCYEPVLRQMEFLYQKMTTISDPFLLSRFHKLKEKWEAIQHERDELKAEQKEDRWLTVFKRVADQVDIMIDGLDRSVVQCYSFIQQIKSSLKKPIPIDKDKFKSVEKSFEAKHKYYTPSIDRMLSMLGNGISARAAKDNQTSQRHESMVQRWHHLKEVMEDLRMRDLIEAERILSTINNNSMSPLPTNNQHDRRSLRFRTPEPTTAATHQHLQHRFSLNNLNSKTDRIRSVTPNAAYGSRRNSLSRTQNPSHYYSQPYENMSDSSSSTSTIKVVQSRTPKPTKSIVTASSHQSSTTAIDFYEEDEKDFGLDMSKLTKQHDRVKDVHTLSRAKSSLGHMYKKDNSTLAPSLSINRRSMTPSLIPRPKTPSKQQQKGSQVPRPKSYQLHRATSRISMTPPVPSLPGFVHSKQQQRQSYQQPHDLNSLVYIPDSKDPLDIELAKIINSSPIQIQCQRASAGRYYFGSESSVSINGGKKLYTCKLMTYTDRKRKGNGQNKVLIRVGGGWQDLEFFLLEHSSFMSTNHVVSPPPPAPPTSMKKKFAANLLNYWKN